MKQASSTINSSYRLFALVEQLLRSNQPSIEQSHSCIVNDIPEDLEVRTDTEMLSSVISGMLSLAIIHAKDSCLRISATLNCGTVQLNLKDYNRFNSYSHPQGLHRVQSMANKLGGTLAVAAMRQGEKTIALSFPDRLDALYN